MGFDQIFELIVGVLFALFGAFCVAKRRMPIYMHTLTVRRKGEFVGARAVVFGMLMTSGGVFLAVRALLS